MALTPFARLEQRASASVDRLMAERIRVEPQAGNGVRIGPDPDRAAYETVAVLDIKPVIANARSSTRYNGSDAKIDTNQVQVSAKVGSLPAKALWPAQGDHLRFLDRDGAPLVKVVNVDDDGIGRVVFHCIWVKP